MSPAASSVREARRPSDFRRLELLLSPRVAPEHDGGSLLGCKDDGSDTSFLYLPHFRLLLWASILTLAWVRVYSSFTIMCDTCLMRIYYYKGYNVQLKIGAEL
jgi:hypothetical protein